MGSSLTKLGLGLLALGLGIFSFAYFDLAQGLREKTVKDVVSNYLINPVQAQGQRKVDYELAQARAQLDFMVWPRERAKLINDLLSSARTKVNLQPFSADGWYVLSQTMRLAKVTVEEQVWAMDKAIQFNEWRLSRKFNLVMECVSPDTVGLVIKYPSITKTCQSLILDSSSQSIARSLSKSHGLDEAQINTILAYFEQEGS